MMTSEDDICALLGCYAAYGGDSLSTFRDSLSGPMFKVQEILLALLLFLDSWGCTDWLSRNVDTKLRLKRAIKALWTLSW